MPKNIEFHNYDAVVSSDISRADNVTRNPERVKRLMKSYARIQGSQATTKVIKDDMAVNDTGTLTEDTIYSF